MADLVSLIPARLRLIAGQPAKSAVFLATLCNAHSYSLLQAYEQLSSRLPLAGVYRSPTTMPFSLQRPGHRTAVWSAMNETQMHQQRLYSRNSSNSSRKTELPGQQFIQAAQPLLIC